MVSILNKAGFHLVYSTNNTISNNDILLNTGEGIGIFTPYSKYNFIHHNNFIGNNIGGKQASDNSLSGNNFWNSSYPYGGNYWSDWTSPDVKSGPNQDVSGSDGIVDSPYSLAGGSGAKDFYPLTTPPPPPVPESPPPALALVLQIILPIVVAVRRRY